MKCSVIIITLNAAETLAECLASVAWADEIIVLDAGSTDATLAICQAHQVRVQSADWQGFGVQKNRALALASGDWVLSLDADEQVSLALREALEQAMQNPAYTAWQMPRLSWFCGRFLRHGGWYPDYVTRLFRRDAAHFSADLVHERLLVAQGSVGTLTEPLLHYPFLHLEQVLDKVNQYSSAGAEMLHERGRRAGLWLAVGKGLWAFLRAYVWRLGLLDGAQGFVQAVSAAEGTYYRYLKLWYKQRPVSSYTPHKSPNHKK